MKIKKQFYSWPNLIADCLSSAKKLKSKKFSAQGNLSANRRRPASGWDFAVAISRGGLIATTLLAYLLKIKKVGTVSYSHYVADGVIGKLELVLAPNEKIKNSRVLLVDDKADTGATLIAAKKLLEKRNNKVTTVTLHYDPHSKIKPDFYSRKVKDIWIVYPWEPPFKK